MFLAKIPNIKVLREFLINKGGYYCMPLQDMTNDFCRVIFLNILHSDTFLEVFSRVEKVKEI